MVITLLPLLMGQFAAPFPATELIVDRGVETVIGVVVGVLVAWLTRSRARQAT